MAEPRYVIETYIYPGTWALQEPHRWKLNAKRVLRRRIKQGYRSRLRDVYTGRVLSENRPAEEYDSA